MMLALFGKRDAPTDEWLAEMKSRQASSNALAARIEAAVEDAGFDPNMLTDLPPGHIAAALVLGVK